MFYIVLEYLTVMYSGIFDNLEDAVERAKDIGGFIVEYDLTAPLVVDEYGEIRESATIELSDEVKSWDAEVMTIGTDTMIRYPLNWE